MQMDGDTASWDKSLEKKSPTRAKKRTSLKSRIAGTIYTKKGRLKYLKA